MGAVLISFLYIPSDSESFTPSCSNLTYSPLLYAPLFSLALVEILLVLNEGVILALSARGPILKKTRSLAFRQRHMPRAIYVRTVVAVLEALAIVASLVGVYHPLVTSAMEACPPLVPRFEVAQAVIVVQVILYFLFLLKVSVYMDPLGCFTPGLLERLTLLDGTDARGSAVISPAYLDSEAPPPLGTAGPRSLEHAIIPVDFSPVTPPNRSVTVDANSSTKEVHIWRHRNTLFDLNPLDIDRATKIHNDSINRKKYERRLRALFCCLGVRGQRSRGVALEDVARGLYTMFSETNSVLSDVIAGFSLLHESQAKKKEEGGEIALTKKFRVVSLVQLSMLLWLWFLIA